jgi:hypothetical protein
MFSQYSSKVPAPPLEIVQVNCEKTGTIWYKKGVEIAWTKEALMTPQKTSKDQYKR